MYDFREGFFIKGFVGDNLEIVIELFEQRRLYNSEVVHAATKGVVQHGLLKGFELRGPFSWGTGDIGAQLLGLYEQEVCATLAYLSRRRDTLVDLGAANGYYGVGLIATGRFARSVCFEMNDAAREQLLANAAYFGVSDRVCAFHAADERFLALTESAGVDFSRAVFLIDVEGAEFDLLTADALHRLQDAYVIIENHDFLRPERYESSKSFVARAHEFFHVAEMHVGARDLRGIPLLEDHWRDADRWLLCSEGRAKLASWFVLSPRDGEALTRERLVELHREYVRDSYES